MRYGFVILHYKALEVTQNCVDSILSLENSAEAFTVIVDNASKNGSAEALVERYRDNENVYVLFKDLNDGFSRGNNAGYEYITGRFDTDFIIIANNDVIFDDADFLKKLDSAYAEGGFFVLGPDIINPFTGEHQSPIRPDPLSLEEISGEIEKNRARLNKLELVCAAKSVKNALMPKKLDQALKKRAHSNARSLDCFKRHENVCLFGACQIFSRDFIAKNDRPYFPETDFYYEEDILLRRCRACGMKVVYRPDISVKHLENASTRASNATLKKHMRFKYENLIAAGEIYKKLAEELSGINPT